VLTETSKESRFIAIVDSDDDDDHGKGKEIADGDDKSGLETPAVSLAGPSKRPSSGAAPAAKRSNVSKPFRTDGSGYKMDFLLQKFSTEKSDSIENRN